ncbi:MAG: ParA family protein [Methylophilaceae bacterium]|nr:ParA family protein [Methylophilaceae bacterium]MDG1453154.1 ParA family protein [Methylophilaceae bacterium]
MIKILIANPKGGSGKTTLSTNLAGYFASQDRKVCLLDLDKQQSSKGWLKRRPDALPKITDANSHSALAKKKNIDIVIIDSPAGIRGDKLSDSVKDADWVIVPMQTSTYDINATQEFIDILKAEKAVRKERTFVAMLGMRVALRTKAAENLTQYLDESGFPVIGNLRNAQIYSHTAEQGISIFDMPAYKAKKDIEQWSPLLKWIKGLDK